MTDLLAAAGATFVRVETVPGVHALSDPGDFWTIVTGSGYRATHDALNPTERNTVRDITLTTLDRDQARAVRTDVIYADGVAEPELAVNVQPPAPQGMVAADPAGVVATGLDVCPAGVGPDLGGGVPVGGVTEGSGQGQGRL